MLGLGGITTFGSLPMTYVLIAGNFMCVGFFLMMMPAMMETFQIAKAAKIGRRVIGWAMVIGFVVAVTSGGYVLLNWGYSRGLSTMRGQITTRDDFSSDLWRWRAENSGFYNFRMRKRELLAMEAADIEMTSEEQQQLMDLRTKSDFSPALKAAGAGTVITCLLGYLRLTFLRFPFHPLGYAVATTTFMSYFWFSVFLAWAIRLTGMRLGGVRVIRSHIQPLMIGLILGSVFAVLIWDAVAMYKVMHGYTGKIYSIW